MESIYNLRLHESVVSKSGVCTTIVPGGWIYSTLTQDSATAVFVPLNNEFQTVKEVKK